MDCSFHFRFAQSDAWPTDALELSSLITPSRDDWSQGAPDVLRPIAALLSPSAPMTAPIPSIATIPIATVRKGTAPIPSIPTIPVATAIVRKVTIPIAAAIVPIASAVAVVARTSRRGDEAHANWIDQIKPGRSRDETCKRPRRGSLFETPAPQRRDNA